MKAFRPDPLGKMPSHPLWGPWRGWITINSAGVDCSWLYCVALRSARLISKGRCRIDYSSAAAKASSETKTGALCDRQSSVVVVFCKCCSACCACCTTAADYRTSGVFSFLVKITVAVPFFFLSVDNSSSSGYTPQVWRPFFFGGLSSKDGVAYVLCADICSLMHRTIRAIFFFSACFDGSPAVHCFFYVLVILIPFILLLLYCCVPW